MKAVDAVVTLEELGSSQWGLITTAQAQQYGISRVAMGRLRDAGTLRVMRRGVYALPSSGHEPLQDVRAAWLATNPEVLAEHRLLASDEVAVSHRSAASVHGLGSVIATRYDFTSCRRRTSSHADITFHRRALEESERVVVNGLLATSVERTVADVSGPGVDLDHLAELVRDALSRPTVDVTALALALTPAAKRLGLRSGDALIEESLDRAGAPAPVANILPYMWGKTLGEKRQLSRGKEPSLTDQ